MCKKNFNIALQQVYFSYTVCLILLDHNLIEIIIDRLPMMMIITGCSPKMHSCLIRKWQIMQGQYSDTIYLKEAVHSCDLHIMIQCLVVIWSDQTDNGCRKRTYWTAGPRLHSQSSDARWTVCGPEAVRLQRYTHPNICLILCWLEDVLWCHSPLDCNSLFCDHNNILNEHSFTQLKAGDRHSLDCH